MERIKKILGLDQRHINDSQSDYLSPKTGERQISCDLANTKQKTENPLPNGEQCVKAKSGTPLTDKEIQELENAKNGGKSAQAPYSFDYESMSLPDSVTMTILLIENTEIVASQKSRVQQIVKKLLTSNLVCAISYGSNIKKGELLESDKFKVEKLFNNDDIGRNACLHDALAIVNDVVMQYYNSIEKFGFKKKKIATIEVIGIGTCVDNCSLLTMQEGIEIFDAAVKWAGIKTKYFCLSENNMVDAATIGFRSIGAITASYT